MIIGKENLLINNLIMDHISEEPLDKNYYLEQALINTKSQYQYYMLDPDMAKKNIQINKDSNLKTFQGVEVFDILKLSTLKEYLTDYPEIYDKSTLEWCSKQKKIIDQLLGYNIPGTFEITDGKLYTKVEYTSKKSLLGRLYCSRISIQYLPKEIRYFLFDGIYKDFDIVNSQFSILADYAKLHQINVPAIFQYVKDREIILTDKMLKDNIDRSSAKQMLLIALNSKENYGKKQGYFSEAIAKDANVMRNHLLNNLLSQVTRRSDVIEKYQDLDQYAIKFQALFCQSQETHALTKLYDFLSKKMLEKLKDHYKKVDKFNIFDFQPGNVRLSFVPFFDGAYITTDDNILNHRLTTFISEYNQKLKNSNIYFEAKPLKVEYKNINIDILNRYLAIKKIITGIGSETKKFNKLLRELDMSPFSLTLKQKLTPDNYEEAIKCSIDYRRKLYGKLMERFFPL